MIKLLFSSNLILITVEVILLLQRLLFKIPLTRPPGFPNPAMNHLILEWLLAILKWLLVILECPLVILEWVLVILEWLPMMRQWLS